MNLKPSPSQTPSSKTLNTIRYHKTTHRSFVDRKTLPSTFKPQDSPESLKYLKISNYKITKKKPNKKTTLINFTKTLNNSSQRHSKVSKGNSGNLCTLTNSIQKVPQK